MLMGELTAVYEMKKRLNKFYPKESWIRYPIDQISPILYINGMKKLLDRYVKQFVFE